VKYEVKKENRNFMTTISENL